MGATDGLRVADDVEEDKADEVVVGFADDIFGLLVAVMVFVADALVDVVAGLAASDADVDFLNTEAVVGLVGAEYVLLALDMTGGVGLTEPAPNVPELITYYHNTTPSVKEYPD